MIKPQIRGEDMRKRISPEDKRSKIIGIKVKESIKSQIEFISEREARPMSTQINIILENYITEYFEKYNINWSDYEK